MTKEKTIDAKDRATPRTLLPLVALGSGLAAAPAAALELGELTVQSNLGQPLRASIAYALAPNEMLGNNCVSITSGPSTSGLPGIGASSITITERAIVITGRSLIREPMLGARVTINCPYTPNLSREYMLLVDPANVAVARAAAPVARPEAAPVTRPAPSAPVNRAPVSRTPIGQSSRYQVQAGESLSEIVSRIENRSMRLWPAVNLIFAANPDAFIDNDPNRLKAGSWLTIPSLDGTAPVVNAARSEPAAVPTATPVEAADASTSAEALVSAYDPAALEQTGRAAEEPMVVDGTTDLMPGDLVTDTAPEQSAGTVIIPDTELEGPQTESASPNVPTAIISTGSRSESTSLLIWLIGGGLALITALLLFGRRARERFSRAPAVLATPYADERRGEDEYVDTGEVETAMHFDIDDDSPTDENLALDANLAIGTGLEKVDMAVEQDFGFAQPTEVDIELPFEPEAPAAESTDVIPPLNMDVGDETILEEEVLPESEDDGEMSVVLDTVKMPQAGDTTINELEALDAEDPRTDVTDSYTIEEEAGIAMLEQDYEEELTATQALNLEIERAAAALAKDVDGDDASDETTEMPLAGTAELDATAELPDPGDDKTVEFEATYDPSDTNAVTVSMSRDENTDRLPVANDDETVEMDVESGKVDTSKR